MQTMTTYLETGSTDPYYNLAFEEFVLRERKDGAYLLLWQNANTIVIGQNQNAEEEINRPFVDTHDIRVVRRSTGGGAVYHDLGNLNYSFITDAGDAASMTFSRFTEPVVKALRSLGLRAEASGRNDVLVEGQKVSGTAQRLLGNRLLHHGTLLFDADISMVAGALNADPAKFHSKSAKSVRSRVGNIRDFLPRDMGLSDFWTYLREALSEGGMSVGALSENELRTVEQLRAEKYSTWEWNFGRSPQYAMVNRHRWEGGSLEVRLEVEKGIITSIVFYGDFLSLCPLDPVRTALTGCCFQRQICAAVLDTLPLERYFGSIQREEILNTMFNQT